MKEKHLYKNGNQDFNTRTITGTNKVVITGLPFKLEAKHVIGGSAIRLWLQTYWIRRFNKIKKKPIPLTNILIAGNTICFYGIKKFRKKDYVILTLLGPDKKYDD